MIFKSICHLRKISKTLIHFPWTNFRQFLSCIIFLQKVVQLFPVKGFVPLSAITELKYFNTSQCSVLSGLSVRSRVKFYWIGKGYAAQPCNGKEWNVLAVRTIAFFSCFIQKTFQRLSVVRAVSQPLDRICFSILPLTRDNVKVPDVKRNGDGYQFEPLQQIQIHLAIPMCQTQYIVMDASSNVCNSYCWAQKLFGLSYS